MAHRRLEKLGNKLQHLLGRGAKVLHRDALGREVAVLKQVLPGRSADVGHGEGLAATLAKRTGQEREGGEKSGKKKQTNEQNKTKHVCVCVSLSLIWERPALVLQSKAKE